MVYERHFPRITRNYSQISKSACYFGVGWKTYMSFPRSSEESGFLSGLFNFSVQFSSSATSSLSCCNSRESSFLAFCFLKTDSDVRPGSMARLVSGKSSRSASKLKFFNLKGLGFVVSFIRFRVLFSYWAVGLLLESPFGRPGGFSSPN